MPSVWLGRTCGLTLSASSITHQNTDQAAPIQCPTPSCGPSQSIIHGNCWRQRLWTQADYSNTLGSCQEISWRGRLFQVYSRENYSPPSFVHQVHLWQKMAHFLCLVWKMGSRFFVASIPLMAEFLIYLFQDKQLAPGMVAGYQTAIAFALKHMGLPDVGHDPFSLRFLPPSPGALHSILSLDRSGSWSTMSTTQQMGRCCP